MGSKLVENIEFYRLNWILVQNSWGQTWGITPCFTMNLDVHVGHLVQNPVFYEESGRYVDNLDPSGPWADPFRSPLSKHLYRYILSYASRYRRPLFLSSAVLRGHKHPKKDDKAAGDRCHYRCPKSAKLMLRGIIREGKYEF